MVCPSGGVQINIKTKLHLFQFPLTLFTVFNASLLILQLFFKMILVDHTYLNVCLLVGLL